MRNTCAALSLMLLFGCATRAAAPGPETSYVATKFCGFVFDGRTSEARFTIDLSIERWLPAGTAVEASFENPLDRDQPIVVMRELKGDERELRIVSTPVKGITQREYSMVVRVYSSRDRAQLLATRTESCRAPFAQGDMGVQYR
ncbi:MAG TPA: hypothetical protein VNT02_01835 [Burkholderiales bacterium]|nr:hypothetical protein [Burkholderiales bacterium]